VPAALPAVLPLKGRFLLPCVTLFWACYCSSKALNSTTPCFGLVLAAVRGRQYRCTLLPLPNPCCCCGGR
jgi:hypothetical protein